MVDIQWSIGVSDYKELVEQNYYFVDKTYFIKDTIANASKVMLFTRPRRFGKTLNLSMLYYFLTDNPEDINPNLFQNTSISQEQTLCTEYQNQCPVIFITFKGVKALNFKTAYASIYSIIRNCYSTLKEKLFPHLSEAEQASYQAIIERSFDNFSDELSALKNSLAYLSQYLKKKTGKKVYILIDEYDTAVTAAYV